jgi:hypothetical protein
LFNIFTEDSNKLQVGYQDILAILDPAKCCSSVQKFIDIYMRLPGIPSNGQLTDSDCIRVRICEGRFALLIREVEIIFLFFPSFTCVYLSHTYIGAGSVSILFYFV